MVTAKNGEVEMSKKRKALSLSDTEAQKAEIVTESKEAEVKAPKTRPHSTTVYLPKEWHVLLKKEAAVKDGERVNDYFLEGLEMFFKKRGIIYTKKD